MSKKERTASFVCEVPLVVSSQEEKALLVRQEVGRQVYNACLGEAKKRLTHLRSSPLYQEAKALPKSSQERKKAFAKAREAACFTDYSLQSYASSLRQSWIGGHLDAHTAQTLGTRAFRAVDKVAWGKAKKVRFKGKNQLPSLEGKSNAAGIRWRDGWVEWSGLFLPARIPKNDAVIEYGLSCRIKYVRLVRRIIRGKTRFYAQLVCEGSPYQKPKHLAKRRVGVVGLDVGPSTLAAVGEESALLAPFCEELGDKQKQIRSLQRKLERQRRALNSENYRKNGTIKPGKKTWKNSKRYKKTQEKLAELYRRQAEHRKSLHGRLGNVLLTLGNTFPNEKLSRKAWQKRYGKSIGRNGPGKFLEKLLRKAESAGGGAPEFPTYTTKLSQTCHCGREKKKKLSERWHECECGVSAQRDLYSAYLARFVEGSTLNSEKASESWRSAEPLLQTAFKEVRKRASLRKIPKSVGSPPPRQSPSSEKDRASYLGGKAEPKNRFGFPFW